jgi:hypothetical protein
MPNEDADKAPDERQGLPEQIAGLLAFRREYVRGATTRAKEKVKGRLRDAAITYKDKSGEGVVQYPDETPFPIFIIAYPDFHPEQVRDDLADLLEKVDQGPCLAFFVTPSDAAESLQTFLLERGWFGRESSVYVWKLDLEGSPGDWTWTIGPLVPIFGDEATRLGRPEDK